MGDISWGSFCLGVLFAWGLPFMGFSIAVTIGDVRRRTRMRRETRQTIERELARSWTL